MTAPNIVGVNTITGITTTLSLTTTSITELSANRSNTNAVYKINSIIAANVSGASANVSVGNSGFAGAGSTTWIARNVGISSGATLVVVDKASSFYLEENRSVVVQASAGNALDVTLSYEEIK